jgi:hypothetical protein
MIAMLRHTSCQLSRMIHLDVLDKGVLVGKEKRRA